VVSEGEDVAPVSRYFGSELAVSGPVVPVVPVVPVAPGVPAAPTPGAPAGLGGAGLRHPVTVIRPGLSLLLCGDGVVCALIVAIAAPAMIAIHVPVQILFVMQPPSPLRPATITPFATDQLWKCMFGLFRLCGTPACLLVATGSKITGIRWNSCGARPHHTFDDTRGNAF
jgi:hypothetical protein